jgi:hypothetical protein
MAAGRLASLGIPSGDRIQFAANLGVKVSGGDRGQEFS